MESRFLPGLPPPPLSTCPADQRIWIFVPGTSAALCQTPTEGTLCISPWTQSRVGKAGSLSLLRSKGPLFAGQQGPPANRRGSPAPGERLCVRTRPRPQRVPGPGQRPGPPGSGANPARLLRRLQAPPSFYAPHPLYLRGENPVRPFPPARERHKLPRPRLGPHPSLSRPGGLHVPPPRPQAGAASGELSPGAGGRGRWGRGGAGAGPGRWPHPQRGGARPAGPMGRGARRPGVPSPPLAPPEPAPPRPGLKPRGRLVAALRALSGARRCERAPRRRHHAPPARAGPGRALPAGAARRRRRRLLRVSARRAPGRAPAACVPLLRPQQGQLFPPAGPNPAGSRTQTLVPGRPAPPRGPTSRPELRLWLPWPRSHLLASECRVPSAAALLTPLCRRPHPARSAGLASQPKLPDSTCVLDPDPVRSGSHYPYLSRCPARALMPSPHPRSVPLCPSPGLCPATVLASSSLPTLCLRPAERRPGGLGGWWKRLLLRPGEGIAPIQGEWRNLRTVGRVRWRRGREPSAAETPTTSQTWRRVNSQNDEESGRGGGVRDWERRSRAGVTSAERVGVGAGRVWSASYRAIVPPSLILNCRDLGWVMGSWVRRQFPDLHPKPAPNMQSVTVKRTAL